MIHIKSSLTDQYITYKCSNDRGEFNTDLTINGRDKTLAIFTNSTNRSLKQCYFNEDPETRITASIQLPNEEFLIIEYQFNKNIGKIGLKVKRPLYLTKLIFSLIIWKTGKPIRQFIEDASEVSNYQIFHQTCIKELLSIISDINTNEDELNEKFESIKNQISNLSHVTKIDFNDRHFIDENFLNQILKYFEKQLKKNEITLNINWENHFHSILRKENLETFSFILINHLLSQTSKNSIVHIHFKKSKKGPLNLTVTCNKNLSKSHEKFKTCVKLLHLIGGRLNFRRLKDLGVLFEVHIPFLIPNTDAPLKQSDYRPKEDQKILLEASQKVKQQILSSPEINGPIVPLDYSASYQSVKSLVVEATPNLDMDRLINFRNTLKNSNGYPNIIIVDYQNSGFNLDKTQNMAYNSIEGQSLRDIKRFIGSDTKIIHLLLQPKITQIFNVTKGIPELGRASVSDKFLEDLKACIENNIESHNLNVDFLTKELGMSRMNLHRKIKKLTGMSTTEIIRFVRIERACILLLNENHNISEVCYTVGFNNLSYFSKVFKEIKGVNPREYLSDKDVA